MNADHSIPDAAVRHPEACFVVPPHMLEAVELRGDQNQREMARAMLSSSDEMREDRSRDVVPRSFRGVARAAAAPAAGPPQELYDAEEKRTLPGKPVEHPESSADPVVRAAWEGAAATARLLADAYGINSLDGQGMTLISTVHYDREYNNAFWNGRQMVYGDGDGVLFKPFTSSLSVIGHELAHGLVQHAGGLVYRDQSGALNEHCADVFGCLTVQFANGEQADEADWLVGAEILGDGVSGMALRSMKAPGTAYDDDVLGRDPQPFHMDDFVVTSSDNGGVHINSGIPNHAFYLLAVQLGGRAWEKAGEIWFDALQAIRHPHAQFADWADQTISSARTRFGAGSLEETMTKRCWKLVGVEH